MLSAASDKSKLFAKNLFKNFNLDNSGISLHVCPFRTNLKQHISITPNMIKKVIMNPDLSKMSHSDCIPVMVLKNCEHEFSFILAELFNICPKESDCRKVSSVVPVSKNLLPC